MSARERLVALAVDAARGRHISTAVIREEFGVSRATAKRDAALIRSALRKPAAASFGTFAATITRGMRDD